MFIHPIGRLAPGLMLAFASVTSAAEPAPTHPSAIDQALADSTPPPAGEQRSPSPAPQLHLIDLSLNILAAAGGSTASDDEIESLEGGGHDPKRRGFTFQAAELSLAGAVDPYFEAEAHLVFGEDGIELEEAFARTTSLPAGLQVKAGKFLTGFGRINPTHAHTWAWVDQPVIASRLLGPDGMRSTGAQVGWLVPTPFYSQVTMGVQNANDESLASFNGEAGGHHHGEDEPDEEVAVGGYPRAYDEEVRNLGDLLWSARVDGFVPTGDNAGLAVGVSGALGPNPASPDGTRLYGADLRWKWTPPGRAWNYVAITTEVMGRNYATEAFTAVPLGPDGVPASGDETAVAVEGTTLKDWGLYAQIEWGFRPGWSAGLRGEYATGSGETVHTDEEDVEFSRQDDPLRDDRIRIAPVLTWRMSEFSRLRLQYNFDRADHLPAGQASSLWLGFEALIGAHPAHGF